MGNYGAKIAKKKHNVEDGDRYQIFNSKYPALKLKVSGQGTGSQVAGNGGFTITISHNLGYVPLCFVDGQCFNLPAEAVVTKFSKWNRFIYQGLQVGDSYYYYADTTNLYIVASLSYLTDVYTFDLDYMYHIYYDEDTLA